MLKNVSRGLVSFRGNSGETWHIPPGESVPLPDFELSENAMLHKLKELRLVEVGSADRKPEAASAHEKPKAGAADKERPEGRDEKEDEADNDERGKKRPAKR
jgi:hypothetical protein